MGNRPGKTTDELLQKLRTLAETYYRGEPPQAADTAARFIEVFQAFDAQLTGGAPIPHAWQPPAETPECK